MAESTSTPSASPPPGLLCYSFNQDQSCFACGTEAGFRVHSCDPPKENSRREDTGADGSVGGVAIVAMLFRTNIFALVGGGANPRFPPNKVMIWDDYQNRCIGELRFRTPVKNVLLRRERVVVVLDTITYVYDFSDLRVIDHIDTGSNPKGLCCLSPSASSMVLACPSPRRGHVRVDLYHLQQQHTFMAHESALSCLAIDLHGTSIATASENGTIIRVFNALNGQPLHEFRRGSDRACISSIAFHWERTFLAVSSDKGTVHVFSLQSEPTGADRDRSSSSIDAEAAEAPQERKSSLVSLSSLKEKAMGYLPKYFASRWSLAQFHMPPELNGSTAAPTSSICGPIVCFLPEPHTLLIVSDSGVQYKCRFDAVNGGECEVISAFRWIRPDSDSTKSSAGGGEDWVVL